MINTEIVTVIKMLLSGVGMFFALAFLGFAAVAKDQERSNKALLWAIAILMLIK